MVADGSIDPIQHRKARRRQSEIVWPIASRSSLGNGWTNTPPWSLEHSKHNYQNMEKDIFPIFRWLRISGFLSVKRRGLRHKHWGKIL